MTDNALHDAPADPVIAASGPSAAQDTAADAASQPAEAAAPPDAWLAALPGEDRDFVAGNGWRSPAELLRSYRNVERMVRERLPLPRGEDDREGLERIYRALGRPDAPGGYRLPAVEGQDPGFTAAAAKWFHAAGLSRRQAAVLAESWNSYVVARARDDAADLPPEEARARIEALKQNKDWTARYLAGDRDALAQLSRLHEAAAAQG